MTSSTRTRSRRSCCTSNHPGAHWDRLMALAVRHYSCSQPRSRAWACGNGNTPAWMRTRSRRSCCTSSHPGALHLFLLLRRPHRPRPSMNCGCGRAVASANANAPRCRGPAPARVRATSPQMMGMVKPLQVQTLSTRRAHHRLPDIGKADPLGKARVRMQQVRCCRLTAGVLDPNSNPSRCTQKKRTARK